MQKKDTQRVYLFKQIKLRMNNSFYLTFFIRKSRKKNCAGKCTIYLRLTYKGQRIESSTNLKIEQEKWSKTYHKAIGNSETSRTVNSCLEDLRNHIYSIYSNKVQLGEPFFVYDLHAELVGTNKKDKTLIQLIKLHNANKKDLIGLDIVKATWDRYETLSSHVSSFLKQEYNLEDIALSKFTYCTLFSWQPFEIFAQATNQPREEAGKEIWNHKFDGEPLKYIEIIETHFKEEYGVDEMEFKALSGILGLKHIYELPTETRCIEITEKIIRENFIFKPTGVSGPD